MKAIEIQNQSLVLCERPKPKPAKSEILIKVKAAGVNRPDILQRIGLYPPPEGITDIPGLEVSGVVEKGHKRFKEGDEVCALLAGGGYAEYVVAPEEQCLIKPANLSFVEAAALPECVFTVWNNVFVIGELKENQNFLVHGGSSGIGSFAIQMALAKGANVYTTVGNPEKYKACKDLGAYVVNYKENAFEDILEHVGFDLILDMVGGDYTMKNLNLLKDNGRLVQIAFLKGKRAEIDLSLLMRKRLHVTGSTLRTRPLAEKSKLREGIEKHIWPLIIKEKIRPIIDKTYPLNTAWKSHVRMESGKHIGKIVLNVS